MLLEDVDYQALEGYLTTVFGKLYGRSSLYERVTRWAIKVQPLNPERYPKGNTQLYSRWELPANPPAKLDYLTGLYASEKDCYSAKHRLLAQIVFMQDAPLGQGLFDDVSSLRKRLIEYDRTLDQGIFCPVTKQLVTIHDIKMALAQTSYIGSSEINIDFVDVSGNGNRLNPSHLHWIKPPYYLHALRQAVLIATNLKALLDKVQRKTYLNRPKTNWRICYQQREKMGDFTKLSAICTTARLHSY